MATEVFLPRLTHDMKSGILVRWLKADGDSVKPGEALFEVETDKAVAEVPAEAGGVLRQMGFKEGDEIPIGAIIGYLLAEGEALPENTKDENKGKGQVSLASSTLTNSPEIARLAPLPYPDPSSGGRIVATPIAKKIARENGMDLNRMRGTGPRGRITEADVRRYLSLREQAAPHEMQPIESAPGERIPLTRIQATTGERMLFSSQHIPQFVLEVDVDMTEAQRLRQRYQAAGQKPIGYTALLIRVAARALQLHPQVNASLDGAFVRRYKEINIGVATATSEGLLVPVVRQAHTLRLAQIQDVLDDIRGQLKRGVINPAFLVGGTFTLSNLGMYGIDRFQALVNPPEAAILAAGHIRDLPWLGADGLQMRPILTLRLSVDHRVLDGAAAAPFLMEIKNLLENPYGLL